MDCAGKSSHSRSQPLRVLTEGGDFTPLARTKSWPRISSNRGGRFYRESGVVFTERTHRITPFRLLLGHLLVARGAPRINDHHEGREGGNSEDFGTDRKNKTPGIRERIRERNCGFRVRFGHQNALRRLPKLSFPAEAPEETTSDQQHENLPTDRLMGR